MKTKDGREELEIELQEEKGRKYREKMGYIQEQKLLLVYWS